MNKIINMKSIGALAAVLLLPSAMGSEQGNYQHIADPGYNADRGPASFWALRLHAEY